MSLVEKVQAISREQMRELANQIEGEMKAEAVGRRAHVRTGMAQASIHIEQRGDTSYFIGARAFFPPDGDDGGTHLYYMTQGNSGNGPAGMIFPREKKALALKDGSLASYVRPYRGRNFIKEIADKYR